MNDTVRRILALGGGVVRWADARRAVPEHVLCHALRAGHLVAPYHGVLVDPEVVADPAVRRRAALACAGPAAALSHTSALAVWGLPATGPADDPVHLTTGPGRRIRVPGIVAHRRAGFVAAPPCVVVRDGVPVTRLEHAIVDSWPLGSADAQRAPLLRAVNERMTTPERVAAAVAARPRLAGRVALARLVDKITAGCRSELELWGHDRVFTGPGMPRFRRQVPVALPTGVIYLDLLHEPSRTNIELDGAKWHASPQQRERDLRRDAALVALGFVVVRFTHDRLVFHPAEVRRESMAIVAAHARDHWTPTGSDPYR